MVKLFISVIQLEPVEALLQREKLRGLIRFDIVILLDAVLSGVHLDKDAQAIAIKPIHNSNYKHFSISILNPHVRLGAAEKIIPPISPTGDVGLEPAPKADAQPAQPLALA